jgi:hypothetical protein
MRLAAIESELPNGFHDAKITAIHNDLRTEMVDIHVELLVGLPADPPARQNAVRSGVLRFSGTKMVIIEQPDVESSFSSPGTVNFVLTEDEVGSLPDDLLKKLRGEQHTYTFFVQEWLSNIKIAATSLEFLWD